MYRFYCPPQRYSYLPERLPHAGIKVSYSRCTKRFGSKHIIFTSLCRFWYFCNESDSLSESSFDLLSFIAQKVWAHFSISCPIQNMQLHFERFCHKLVANCCGQSKLLNYQMRIFRMGCIPCQCLRLCKVLSWLSSWK